MFHQSCPLSEADLSASRTSGEKHQTHPGEGKGGEEEERGMRGGEGRRNGSGMLQLIPAAAAVCFHIAYCIE